MLFLCVCKGKGSGVEMENLWGGWGRVGVGSLGGGISSKCAGTSSDIMH